MESGPIDKDPGLASTCAIVLNIREAPLLTRGLAQRVTRKLRCIELAQSAGRLITAAEHVELVRPPGLSCVLFRRIGWAPDDYWEWTYRNHKAGFALVAPTKSRAAGLDETITRFCFISPDTTEKDIADILDTMR